MPITATDFKTLKDEALRTFDARVAKADPNMCCSFDIEVARLESQIVQLYGVAALTAKKEDALEKVAAIWRNMIGICDDVATRLQELRQAHPFCTASHDKILDIRNKCTRLYELHA